MAISEEKQKLYILLQGILEAIVDQAETAELFTKLCRASGLRARAADIARADRALKRLQARKDQVPEEDLAKTTEAREKAEGVFWNVKCAAETIPGLRRDLRDFIRGFGMPLPGISADMLIGGLWDRFCRDAAKAGGWPLPVPDAGHLLLPPQIGKRFTFTIPEDCDVRLVEAMLTGSYKGRGEYAGKNILVRDPEWSLPAFVETVRAQIRTVKGSGRGGRPVHSYADKLREDGQLLFLVESGRRTAEQMAADLHQGQSKRHWEVTESEANCGNCRYRIERRLKGARKILALDE